MTRCVVVSPPWCEVTSHNPNPQTRWKKVCSNITNVKCLKKWTDKMNIITRSICCKITFRFTNSMFTQLIFVCVCVWVCEWMNYMHMCEYIHLIMSAKSLPLWHKLLAISLPDASSTLTLLFPWHHHMKQVADVSWRSCIYKWWLTATHRCSVLAVHRFSLPLTQPWHYFSLP